MHVLEVDGPTIRARGIQRRHLGKVVVTSSWLRRAQWIDCRGCPYLTRYLDPVF